MSWINHINQVITRSLQTEKGAQSIENQSKPNRNLALLGAAHSLNHSLFVITPPLLSMIITSLGVTKFEIGLASTTASMIYGAGALLGGPLGDRIGEVKAIAICLAMAGLPAPLMLIAGFGVGLYVYAGTLAFMAFWASLYHPVANSYISKVFKVRVYEAMGLHGVGGTLGIVLAPTIAWFLGAYFGWPWAFIFFGAISAILAAVFMKAATHPGAAGRAETKLSEVLRIRSLSTVLVVNVTIGLFMKGVELFFPTYLKEMRGVSDMWASIAYTLVLTFGVAGQWIGGKAASQMGPRKVVIITMAGICCGMVSLLLMPIYIVGIAVFIALYGLSFYGHQPALNALMGFLAPYNLRGAVFGIYFFTSFGIGSISQLIAGYVADVYGLDAAFYLLTVFAIAALLFSFKLPSRTEK